MKRHHRQTTEQPTDDDSNDTDELLLDALDRGKCLGFSNPSTDDRWFVASTDDGRHFRTHLVNGETVQVTPQWVEASVRTDRTTVMKKALESAPDDLRERIDVENSKEASGN